MTTEATLFDSPEGTTPPEAEDIKPTPPAVDPNAALLALITNEEGAPKYKSVEDAIKALKASQDHIRTLESDNATLRQEANRITALEEIVESIKEKSPSSPAPAVDLSAEIPEMVQRTLTEIEAKRVREANRSLVVEAATAAFGKEKVSEEFYARAAQQGLSVADVNALAEKSPKAVLSLLKIEAPKAPSAPLPSGVRTEGFLEPKSTDVPSAMRARSSKDLTAAWAASKQATLKRLGLIDH